MKAVILLALLGQCGPGGCPRPMSYGPSFSPYLAPSYINAAPVVVQPARQARTLTRSRIRYNGLSFEVEGERQANGNILWDRASAFNAASYWAADRARNRSTATMADKPQDEPVDPDPPSVEINRGGLPRKAEKPVKTAANFGIDVGKLHPNKDSYTAPSDEARRFIEEAKSSVGEPVKLHVTVIGDKEQREPVAADLANHPAFASIRDGLLIQEYSRNEWPVDNSLGYHATGEPTILVQTADSPSDPRAKGGKVLLRASKYDGPEKLAEAIRKADPSYLPELDPTPEKVLAGSEPGLPFDLPEQWASYALAGCVAVFLLLRLPRKDG